MKFLFDLAATVHEDKAIHYVYAIVEDKTVRMHKGYLFDFESLVSFIEFITEKTPEGTFDIIPDVSIIRLDFDSLQMYVEDVTEIKIINKDY